MLESNAPDFPIPLPLESDANLVADSSQPKTELDRLEDRFFDLIRQWCHLSPEAKRAILDTATREMEDD